MHLDFNNVNTFQVIVYIYLFIAGVYRNNVPFHTITCDFLQLDRFFILTTAECKMEIWI